MAYDANYWHDELKRYDKDYKKFNESGRKIIKRYKDDRKDTENSEARFNILWSNIRTLKPAIYSRPPKIEVSRRFDDQDDVARVASMIIERSIEYELKQYNDYHTSLSNCVEDRLLPGRGVAWIRYEPTIETVGAEPQISEDDLAEESEEPLERVTSERCPIDYIFWQDFAHLPARTWEEVTWVARRVYMSAEEGEERFGEVFSQVPLTHSPDKDEDEDKNSTQSLKKAVVWEIWCKPSKTVYWIAEHFEEMLDEREDPLELEEFFPCPKPIFATITTDSLVPVADFKLYQDQADEIDEVTGRIKHLTKALKVMGIYAADEPSLARLMKEGNDAVMIPVTNWPAFVEKGGLQGAVQFMPLRDIIAALQQLYVARESCKQIIYETTGISDILRGASAASETATAQQIKSQFASIRLNDMKDDVARFARDLLRMKAEVICLKYQPEVILQISGIAHTEDAQFAPQAIALLKNDMLRNFSIDIQTDTLVQLDEQAEKQSRMEFLAATSQFMEKAVQASQVAPDMAPLAMQMLLFGIRGFKVGRELEGVFERTAKEMMDKSKQPQPQKPDPEQMKMQAEMQAKQMDMQASQQVESAKLQAESQFKQMDIQAQMQKLQAEAQIEQQAKAIEFQREQTLEQMRIESAERIKAAEIAAAKDAKLIDLAAAQQSEQAKADQKKKDAEKLEKGNAVDKSIDSMAQMMQMIQSSNDQQTKVLASIMQQLNKPKKVVRGPDGKMIGVE